jgi:hypothetical protein
MRYKIIKLVVVGAVLTVAGAGSLMAQSVDPGYDLLATQPGTTFMGAPFEGVPLGSYNFGGVIGVQPVGTTDTIVQRLAAVSAPVGTTPLLMDALQLQSTTPISLGGGPLGFYYITLQSADNTGPASTGAMTINFAPNTFSSSLDVFFDVHFGALNGPIVLQSDAILSSSGTAWGNVAPPGAITIPGANLNLNGTNNAADFWPVGPFTESEPGVTHSVDNAAVPEPATGALLLLGVALCALCRPRRSSV